MALITSFIIVGLNVIIPYHSQQKTEDTYLVGPRLGQATEDKRAVASLEGEVHHPQISDADANAGPLEGQEGSSDQEDPGILSDDQLLEGEVLEELTEDSTDKDWMDEKLRKYGDDIPEEDMKDFRSITGKLDMAYATGLLEDPGGEEGELRLKQYLRSNLSSYEYERSKELFFLYNYILWE